MQKGQPIETKSSLHQLQQLTCGLPQSQASSLSRIPLPQTGSPAVMVGSLVRQQPRLKSFSPSWRSDLLQSLHWVGRGLPKVAAMMQLPDGSEHEHNLAAGNWGGQIPL